MPVTDAAFDALKDRIIVVERTEAVRDEVEKTIVERLGKIETVLSRLTWLVISAVLGGFITFALSGGLAHVTIGG